MTLARRRAMLTSRTPRQIAVPLIGPALLALILAPALQKATGGLHSNINYTAFVGVGAVCLVIPLSCVFAGLSVLVDRSSGAQRELPAAPIPRAYLVLGNMVVALGLAALQMRYGLIDPSGRGLHDIWGMSNVTLEAWLSVAVVALYAALLTMVAIKVFSCSAVR
jgi:hypothetical protein